jgi:acetyl-CoA acyltransferase
MVTAVIVDAVRTPMARAKETGALHRVHPVDLLSETFSALMERTGMDPGLVDDVLIGCVSQAGEQSSTPGRQAWLGAGLPQHVPSTTIERKCGSSQQAIDFATQGIISGAYDIVVAGGIEMMSRVPMGSAAVGKDTRGSRARAHFPLLPSQGVSAELVAQRWQLQREELDDYAVRSHELADRTRSRGGFSREIVPITVDGARVSEDETIRPGTTAERLAGLPAAFAREPWLEAYPDIDWKVTAGNSSQLTDGAASLLIMSEQKAAELGLRPRARLLVSAVVADDPVMMLTAPIPATRKVLARHDLTLDDIDAFEVNEAFASVPLAWSRELGVPLDRVNTRGGAIALGHPLGASGARLMTSLLTGLEETGGRFGLQTMCEAGGMANATIIERLD